MGVSKLKAAEATAERQHVCGLLPCPPCRQSAATWNGSLTLCAGTDQRVVGDHVGAAALAPHLLPQLRLDRGADTSHELSAHPGRATAAAPAMVRLSAAQRH